jgi:hypothetical protein
MMRRLLLCLTTAFLVASCTTGTKQLLPDLPPMSGRSGIQGKCTAMFPEGRWQFVHTIAFHMANGNAGTALGVVVLAGGEVNCALMTVEGLTLFEARSAGGGDLQVMRAIPPFDNREFAAGLMRDIRTIFFQPAGEGHYGRLPGNAPVCRYIAAGQVTDILPREDGCWRLDTYSDRVRTRSIRTRSCRTVDTAVLPEFLELVADGPAGYTLNMHLVSAERLQPAI